MTTYRTGNHWGVTIVREPLTRPCDDRGPHYCVALGENAEHPDSQLVAVVVNGDQALAERICALLNAHHVKVCNWCDVPAEPDPARHPGGTNHHQPAAGGDA